ncbi:MAG: VOC family protein [Deltaproteobacteria bacterium]|nr:VOC family protein [Deltaproteobacteria bacterium]
MARSAELGIRRLEDIVFYVHDIARSHQFYTERVDFALIGRSTPGRDERRGETVRVYQAGDVRVTVTQPIDAGSESGRYLKRHPDGIATLVFEVADVAKTFAVLDERGATIVDDVRWHDDGDGGRLGSFEITTPFGEGRFRFVERAGGYAGLGEGMESLPLPGTTNRFGFERYDHVTSNFLTLGPMELWCKEVLGLEEFWEIEFHTDDVAHQDDHGSGLKSTVLWDPHSGVKFANNEPKRPFFESSQIYTFVMDNLGPGFQHVALTTTDIIATVKGLRDRGVVFMPTPGSYYDVLPERIARLGIGGIDEDIEVLRGLEILVDGAGERSYLLQIFLKEASGLYADAKAGPFFFEIIQRKGDAGFGGGNFRALFESIELEEKRSGKRA